MRRFRLGAVVVGLTAMLLLATGAQAGKPPQCLILNDATSGTYTSLQAAQDEATAGDTLWVQGTCTGISTISKSLTISGLPAKGYSAPTLDGGGLGSVLAIIDPTVDVTIDALTITGGSPSADFYAGMGGGIVNTATLTVNNSTISGNAGSAGGGILDYAGTVTLHHTTISGNTVSTGSGVGGGGLVVWAGTVTLNDSNINGNSSTGIGGGALVLSQQGDSGDEYPAALILNGKSRINGNSAPSGGGVVIAGSHGVPASVALNDSSRITNNTATGGAGELDGIGGGVFLVTEGAALTLTGSSVISGNVAAVAGGGIAYNTYGTGTTLTNCNDGDNVYRNEPDDIYALSIGK